VAILGALPLAFVGLFSYFPQLDLYLSGLSQGDFLRVILSPLSRLAALNSLTQALLSATLAVLVGYPGGLIMARYRFPLKGAFQATAIVPFMLPTVVVATAFTATYGPAGLLGKALPWLSFMADGFTGIIAVNVFYNAPLVMFLVASSIERVDPELLHAASIFGGNRLHYIRRFLLPQTVSGAATGFLFTFLYSFMAFAVPLIVGGPRNFTLEVQIYTLFKQYLDFRGAAALALVQLAGLGAASYFYLSRTIAAAERTPASTGSAFTQEGLSLRRRRASTLSVLMYMAPVGFFLFAPIVGLALESLSGREGWSFDSYARLASTIVTTRLGIPLQSIVFNTVFFAAITSALAVSLGLISAYLTLRVFRSGRKYELFLFLPMMFSPVTTAFALYVALESQPPFNLIWPLIIASHVLVALPLTVRFLSNSLSKVPSELIEAASVSGSSRADALFRVELPLTWAGFVAAGAFAFATSLGEFAATNFLVTPEYTTMTVAVYQLLGLRMTQEAYALSTLLVLASFAIFAVAFRLQEELSLG